MHTMFIRFGPILLLPDILNIFSGQAGELSAFLANMSFLLLFGAMFSYWLNLVFSTPEERFSSTEKEKTSQNNGLPENLSEFSPVGANQEQLSLYSSAKLSLTNVNQTFTSEFTLAGNNSDLNTNQQGVTRDLYKRGGKSTSRKTISLLANLANKLIVFANISLFLLLGIRWQESGHFPLSNLYESLIFLSWCCTTVQLFLIWYYVPTELDIQKDKKQFSSQMSPLNGVLKYTEKKSATAAGDIIISELLGSVLAPCALFLNAFATFSLPKEMQLAGPLVPALQSNWLMMHVTVMIISYAALMLGSLLSITYLILARIRASFNKPVFNNNGSTQLSFPQRNSLSVVQKQMEKKEVLGLKQLSRTGGKSTMSNTISDNLDYLSYRIIGIGFPFLTIGILSGAVWANEAWGSYWSWDPKETWALLTWLVFAIYLHTRITKGWEGERPAMLASFGFIVVWICYLGVNLLGEGLHSYGFFSS